MPSSKVDMIAGPYLTHEARAWNRWLKAAAEIANTFGAVEDDPFSYNEAATVNLLTAAAVKVEMLALAEFVSTKRHHLDHRVAVNGRCDLWICSDKTSWAFEFKQVLYEGANHKASTIRGWLEDACRDARKLAFHEADKRFGVLVIPLFWAERVHEGFLRALDEVARSTDYAWRITPNSDFSAGTYILFQEVRGRSAKGQNLRKSRKRNDV